MLTEKWGRHVGSGLTFRDERKDKVKRKKRHPVRYGAEYSKGKICTGNNFEQ